jgi:undecaprenyl-diphosphatase
MIVANLDTMLLELLISMREPVGIFFFSTITHLADTTVVILVLLVASLLLLLKNKRYAVGLVVATLGAKISEMLIKIIVERARPLDVGLLQLDTYSFPSGHATAAMALYGFFAYVLWQVYPKWRVVVLAVSTLIIGGVGISRIYLGVHYPSDVLGGYLLGLLWIFIATRIVHTMQNR